MTPEQRIKRQILIDSDATQTDITEDNVDGLFDEANSDYELQEAIEEFRSTGTETPEIPTPDTRYLEVDAVARQLDDGFWVGWPHYYGGGKHAEPEAMEWMGASYLLDCKEEEKLMTVRTFTIIEEQE